MRSNPSGQGYASSVHYQVDGKEYTTKIRQVLEHPPRVGDKMALAYLPDKVEHAGMLDKHPLRYLLPAASLVVGMIMLVSALVVRQKWLAEIDRA